MKTPHDFGAVGDGVADDTQALRDAANAVASTGELLTCSGGEVYRITDTVTFHGHANIDLGNAMIAGDDVIVQKAYAGVMRLRADSGTITVKRLPKPGVAEFTVSDSDIGVDLAGEIEMSRVTCIVDHCTIGVRVQPSEANATLDESRVEIQAYDCDTALAIESRDRQLTGEFHILAEQINHDAIKVSGGCRVELSGYLRGICKETGSVGVRVFEDGGRPHVSLDNLKLLGVRKSGTQPFAVDGCREFQGAFSASNF